MKTNFSQLCFHLLSCLLALSFNFEIFTFCYSCTTVRVTLGVLTADQDKLTSPSSAQGNKEKKFVRRKYQPEKKKKSLHPEIH